ncbi:MAG: hypothetical protein ACN6QT_06105 [Burkholderia contaminans]|uniref:Uncharacterized protein n=1 Tax=Burkholderia aenigmatica TaxID=2015348 RepID=A0A228HP41_9BURK|nr:MULTISPECIES: hypothetical protein [Burkholderia cepacia complex]KVR79840.1 hypothetical protein WK24_30585 [Burkholderia vietnamiensis]KVS19410.1 hypothetical protein WK32_21400 [Burkholderia vietnamiensis]MBR8009178.1 hypothetical protein [Burkholderia vietnamiensis]MBR8151523.1 hypothetical protein [Burkholderia vietnamiensis]MBR8164655.1 hypothetical protein [Burkholderia vietnamiensis]
MRVIIHSTSRGTLLDYNGFFGWAFFSHDSGDVLAHVKAKQTARTFVDESDARAFIDRIDGVSSADSEEVFPSDLSFVQVGTDSEYAPVDVCVAAGVPSWTASEMRPVAPFRIVPHTADVGHTLVIGSVRAGKTVFRPHAWGATTK